MDSQLPAAPYESPAHSLTSGTARQPSEKHLFNHTIQDENSIPAANLCCGCLSGLGNYSADAFAAADASKQLAAGKLKPLGRRLDGTRLRLQIWMSDIGLSIQDDSETTQSNLKDEYLGEATVRKIRRMVQSCNAAGSSLQRVRVDLEFASLTAENGYIGFSTF